MSSVAHEPGAVREPSLEERAYQAVVEWLTEGAAVPGEPVPLRELAKRLGMSRTPLRAAVGRLREQGLLAYHERLGFTVSSPTVADLRELFDLRLMCELHAVRHHFDGSPGVVPEQLASAVRDISELAEQVGDDPARYADFLRRDDAFHRAIVALGENRRLVEWYGQLNLRIVIFCAGATVPMTEGRFLTAAAEHAAFVDALEIADEDGACERLEAHLRRVRDETIDRLARSTFLRPSDIR
jgi:DNA-binding GntR family transcriptional regulator